MPARGSFQKHQKEMARKEKRQQKLDRRQGRTPPGATGHSSDSPAQPDDEALENQETPESNPVAANHPSESLQ